MSTPRVVAVPRRSSSPRWKISMVALPGTTAAGLFSGRTALSFGLTFRATPARHRQSCFAVLSTRHLLRGPCNSFCVMLAACRPRRLDSFLSIARAKQWSSWLRPQGALGNSVSSLATGRGPSSTPPFLLPQEDRRRKRALECTNMPKRYSADARLRRVARIVGNQVQRIGVYLGIRAAGPSGPRRFATAWERMPPYSAAVEGV